MHPPVPKTYKLFIDGAFVRTESGRSAKVAGPDGAWVLEPVVGQETLEVVELDHTRVLEERHSLDVAGHYSRPDVVSLRVNRKRQTTAEFDD